MTRAEAAKGAVVLLASPQVADHLQQVIDSGWPGPVVLVSSIEEARALVGAPPAGSHAGSTGSADTAHRPDGPALGRDGATDLTGVLPGPSAHGADPAGRDADLAGVLPGPSADGAEPSADGADPVAAPPARLRLILDPDRQVAVCEGQEEHLTPLEFGFLQALLVRPGRVCAFPDLTQQVWGTRHLGDMSQVHSLVKRVRRKLDAIGSPVQVQAIRGVGFRAVVRRAPTTRT